jgi:hypothetical protein
MSLGVYQLYHTGCRHSSVDNFMSLGVYQLYHTGCRHSSVGNIQSNCNKRTCLQSLSAIVFSAILFCSELCQAMQVHKRYTDPLWLYRHRFDITEFTAFQNYTAWQGLKLQLDWELSRTVKLVMEPESVREMCVYLDQLTLLTVWEDSIVLYVGWPQSGCSEWRGES